MCRIGGIFSETKEEIVELQLPMLTYLERGGPDGFGYGLINPHHGNILVDWFVNKGEGDYKSEIQAELEKLNFFTRIEMAAKSTRPKFALSQSKYSTRTNEQKTDYKELEKNMQPTHLYYDNYKGLEERIHDCIGVHNGEIEDQKLLKLINPESKNPANVDSRFLTEIYYQKIRELKDEWKAAQWVMEHVKGSFSFGFSSGKSLIFFKDRLGIRPLCIGSKGNSIITTSESGFFQDAYINYEREIKNGEMIKINSDGNIESKILIESESRPCGFELYYFGDFQSRDPSGKLSIGNDIRFRVGVELAKMYKNQLKGIDLVGYTPDSGKSYAQGFGHESGIPDKDICRKTERKRYFLTRKGHKYSIDRIAVEGKNIAACDDSLVRADTIQKFYHSMKKNGAKKVKVFIGWPPIVHKCNLGIDMPIFNDLFAYKLVEEGDIKMTENGAEYDINEINKIITTKIREEMKGNKGYNDVNLNDLEIYFGTKEIIKKVIPYKVCTQCFSGISPFSEVKEYKCVNI